MVVEHLQHHRLLEVAHGLAADLGLLARVGLLERLEDAAAQGLLVELGVLLQPPAQRQALAELALDGLLEPGDVPLLLDAVRGDIGAHHRLDHVAAHLADGLRDVIAGEQLVALRVDHLALVVGDVVVLEQVLAHVEVVRLDLALGVLDRLRHPRVLDGLALLHAELLHQRRHAVGGEDAHQAVLEREVEAARARVALAPGAPAELVVDAARLVALGADDVQAAELDHPVVAPPPLLADARDLLLGRVLQGGDLGVRIAAEDDVGAPAGHVGGDGHRPGASGLGDDLRLLLVVLGVEHLVRDARLAEQLREVLGGLDRGGAHQHRLPLGVALADVLDDGVELLALREEDEVRQVLPDHRLVGGDHHHLEAVDLLELVGLGVGRARHARQLLVLAEVVLEGDGGERLVLALHRHPLLGLDRLVQALGPAPPGHGAARELVDDHHLAVAHDVVHVALVERVRAQRRVEVVQELDVARVVEALALGQEPRLGQQLLDLLVAGLGEVDLLELLVDGVVALALLALGAPEARDDLVDAHVELGIVLGRTGDDERRARLVDEDGVHLVDDGVVQPALDLLLEGVGHVVAQVVEAELVVGAVGDVGGIGLAARHGPKRPEALVLGAVLRVVEVGCAVGAEPPRGVDHAHAEAEGAVDRSHPARVAPGQVVVDRDDVHALAGQGVEIGRERRHQGLALAGAHLGDLAVVQHHAADELHVEVAHAEGAARRLAHHGEGLGQELVEGLAFLEPLAELAGLGPQSLVGERPNLALERVDALDHLAVAPEQPLVAAAEDLPDDLVEHGVPWPICKIGNDSPSSRPRGSAGSGRGAARGSAPCRADVAEGVDHAAPVTDLEVDVRAGGAAAAAHEGDGLALLHAVADAHQVAQVVGVAGDVAVAVVDLDHEAVAVALARPGDDPARHRHHRRAQPAGEIHPAVVLAPAGEGVGAPPVVRGKPAPAHRAARGRGLAPQTALHEQLLQHGELALAVLDLARQPVDGGEQLGRRLALLGRGRGGAALGGRAAEVELAAVELGHLRQAPAEGVEAHDVGLHAPEAQRQGVQLGTGARAQGLEGAILLGEALGPAPGHLRRHGARTRQPQAVSAIEERAGHRREHHRRRQPHARLGEIQARTRTVPLCQQDQVHLEPLINPPCGLISTKVLRDRFDCFLYCHALPCAWTVPRPSPAAGKL